jgi:hypothetical protein
MVTPAVLLATKYAGEFLELGVGGRICAMGLTGVAQGTDPAAFALNPGLSAHIPRALLLMHAENFGGIVKNEYGSFVIPKNNAAYGAAFQYVSVSGIKLTRLADSTQPPGNDNPPVPYDTVSTRDAVLYLNGCMSKGIFSYGANVKVYYRDLYVLTGYGGGVDAGGQVHLPNLTIGIAVRDFMLAPIIWNNDTEENIAPKMALGVAPVLPIGALDSRLTIEIDLVKTLDIQGYDLNVGVEYEHKGFLSGRLGLTGGRFCLGAGLKYKKLTFDYALMTHSTLEISNKFSAGIEF